MLRVVLCNIIAGQESLAMELKSTLKALVGRGALRITGACVLEPQRSLHDARFLYELLF